MIDRRIYLRVPTAVSVSIGGQDFDGTVTFITADLSAGGFFVESDLWFDVGTSVSVRIDDAEGLSSELNGTVAWVERGGEDRTPGMGIAFADIGSLDRHALAALVAGASDSAISGQ